MRRAGLGAAGVVKQRERVQRMNEVGARIEENRTEEARAYIEEFKAKLTEFATKYRSRIQQDPVFREQFVSMCDSLGVDPIQTAKSGGSGWLSNTLGISTFYSDLAVQILTQCMIHRKSDFGSLLPVSKCMEVIQTDNVSLDDIRRSIATLDCFGSGGVRLVNIGNSVFISSLPAEMSSDSTLLLSTFGTAGGFTCSTLVSRIAWSEERTLQALEALVNEGSVWIDTYEGLTTYWVLSLWLSS